MMMRSSITTIHDLPELVLANILSLLPQKTIFSCMCVCKTWRSFVSKNRVFAMLHFERSTIRGREILLLPDGKGSLSRSLLLLDLDKLKPYAEFQLPLTDEFAAFGIDIIGSCNGLVCLCNYYDKNPAVVCNPFVKEYVNIPRSGGDVLRKFVNPIGCKCGLCSVCNKVVGSQETMVASAFGFSPRDNQYKVLKVFNRRPSPGFGNVNSSQRRAEIFSVDEGSWRTVDGFVPQIPHSFLFSTYLEQTVSWVCSNDDHKFEFIVYFDFNEDGFDFISPPADILRNLRSVTQISMQELKGCLSLCDFFSAMSFDLYFMKDFGGRKVWIKSFVIMWHGNITVPIKFLNDEEMLMLQGSWSLVSYNFKVR